MRRCASTLPKTTSKRSVDWVDNKHDGHVYSTSFNKTPGSICPVLVARRHLPKVKEEGKENKESDANTDNKDGEDICLFPMLWGLVPGWHEGHPQKTGLSTSNCRSEGMLEKKMFSECLRRHQRCVIVVDGFYEWNSQEVPKPGALKKSATMTKKQPYFIFDGSQENARWKDETIGSMTTTTTAAAAPTIANQSETVELACDEASEMKPESAEPSSSSSPPRLLAVAGVFGVGSPRPGEGRDPKHPLYSYSVITVASGSALKWLHHRQPAVLTSEEEILSWLGDGELRDDQMKGLIRAVDSLRFYPVSTLVNNARINDEKCMAPIDLEREKEKEKPKSNALTNWLSKGGISSSSSSSSSEGSKSKDEKSSVSKATDKKETNLMSSWLAKGKRKSDYGLSVSAGDSNKKIKTD